jgi:hypothetical protein
VPLSEPVVVVAAPADGSTWFTGFEAESPQLLQLSPQDASFQLCPDCTGSSTCQQVGATELTIDAGASVLQIPTQLQPNDFTSVTLRAR